MPDDASPRTHRRRFLAAVTGSLPLALAGCLGGSDDGATDSSTADPTTNTPEPTESDATTSEGTPETTDQPTTEPTTTQSAPRDVSFQSSAGETIEATLYGQGSCGLILVPQINLDRESWEPQARRWAEQGHLVAAIDEGEQKTAGVRAAVQYLTTEQGVSTVVLVGASAGGKAAIEAAAAESAVSGVAGLSASGGADVADQLDMRVFLAVSEGDADRFVQTTKDVRARAGEPKELQLYDGSAHGQRLFDSDHADDLLARLDTFVEKSCVGQ
ncbi:dienelactone hydrolase family protein [Haloarchaeobius sp. DFWS5]|uniref:dienelactone hydrolase family protein n=1 Tax=Haloarchaeobius sp. DFWS5 TaxID=3446114 RepID=UPI003EB733EC